MKRPLHARIRYPLMPVPEHLRHRIEAGTAGGFDLITHRGYVLYHHEDRAEVERYFAQHCPMDEVSPQQDMGL